MIFDVLCKYMYVYCNKQLFLRFVDCNKQIKGGNKIMEPSRPKNKSETYGCKSLIFSVAGARIELATS